MSEMKCAHGWLIGTKSAPQLWPMETSPGGFSKTDQTKVLNKVKVHLIESGENPNGEVTEGRRGAKFGGDPSSSGSDK